MVAMSFPKNMRGSTPDSQTVRHVEMPSTGMHSKTLQNVVLKSSLEFPSRGTTPFSARSQNKPVTLFQPRGPYLLPHLAALSTIPSRPHRQEDEEDEEDEAGFAAATTSFVSRRPPSPLSQPEMAANRILSHQLVASPRTMSVEALRHVQKGLDVQSMDHIPHFPNDLPDIEKDTAPTSRTHPLPFVSGSLPSLVHSSDVAVAHIRSDTCKEADFPSARDGASRDHTANGHEEQILERKVDIAVQAIREEQEDKAKLASRLRAAEKEIESLHQLLWHSEVAPGQGQLPLTLKGPSQGDEMRMSARVLELELQLVEKEKIIKQQEHELSTTLKSSFQLAGHGLRDDLQAKVNLVKKMEGEIVEKEVYIQALQETAAAREAEFHQEHFELTKRIELKDQCIVWLREKASSLGFVGLLPPDLEKHAPASAGGKLGARGARPEQQVYTLPEVGSPPSSIRRQHAQDDEALGSQDFGNKHHGDGFQQATAVQQWSNHAPPCSSLSLPGTMMTKGSAQDTNDEKSVVFDLLNQTSARQASSASPPGYSEIVKAAKGKVATIDVMLQDREALPHKRGVHASTHQASERARGASSKATSCEIEQSSDSFFWDANHRMLQRLVPPSSTTWHEPPQSGEIITM